MVRNRGIGERLFDAANVLFQVLFALTIILPFVYILLVSLTNQTSISYFFARHTRFSLAAYQSALSTKLWRAFVVSVLRTVIGTGLNMLFTSMMAYVVSRKGLPGGRAITFLMVFTMLFSAGLIPNYLLIVNVLHLRNSYLVYVLPGLISAYNCVLLSNGFQQVPSAVVESVRIDGGSDWRILFGIMMPLALPTIATVALFYAVGHWNAWFDSVLYMSDSSKYTMQVVLRAVSYNTQLAQEMGAAVSDSMMEQQLTPEAVVNATLVLTTLPIVCVYPFLQRYFIKGITLGAIKEWPLAHRCAQIYRKGR